MGVLYLNQGYNNHMCLFELFSQVSDVDHGPIFLLPILYILMPSVIFCNREH